MYNLRTIFYLSVSVVLFISCETKENQAQTLESESVADTLARAENVNYTYGDKSYISYVAYKGDTTHLKPVVLIIPEWWGLDNYARNRAKMLAEEGYFAMALDFYGKGQIVSNPEDAQKMAAPFYEDPALALNAYEAARHELRRYVNADTANIVVMGYCFGGAHALNLGRQKEDLKGAVSFHGNLMTGVKPNNNSVKMLVLNGEADSFVSKEEIEAFKAEMDSAKIDYQLINYPNAVHAFTNPEATELGKKFDLKIAYNEEADKKSWEELLKFLQETIGESK